MNQMSPNWWDLKYKNALEEIGVFQSFKAKLMATRESYHIGKKATPLIVWKNSPYIIQSSKC